eukprot:364215-Chlamydomonas_euryale.AAC.14
MLEGGFTLPQMFQGLKQGLDEYRKWIAAEEQVIADPIKHQQFLKVRGARACEASHEWQSIARSLRPALAVRCCISLNVCPASWISVNVQAPQQA